ncbi:MAG: single-stranded DNA-binding protein [bacterium]|nr:single-stranded DNA-binding protein [bacterium]
MANEIQVTIRGNAGGDPQLHEGPNGGVVVRFTVAVAASRYVAEQNETVYGDPQWFTVKTFGAHARNVKESVRKGTPVLVRGELHTETWTDKDGEQRSAQVIRADCVAVALTSGTATFTKYVRNSALAEAVDSSRPVVADVSGLQVQESEAGAGEMETGWDHPGEEPDGRASELVGAKAADAPF